MGAPKQKWTPEEEAALKAGIVKHGAGKWRTILKDPEFSRVLYMRSNVDLKVLALLVVLSFSLVFHCPDPQEHMQFTMHCKFCAERSI